MTTIKSKTERIVELFKTADKSTFMHEMGHVFFDDIKTLAEMENAPEQLVTDWNKLKNGAVGMITKQPILMHMKVC